MTMSHLSSKIPVTFKLEITLLQFSGVFKVQ